MNYSCQLRRVRRILRGGRVLGAVAMLLALAALLWLAFGLADAAAAFEPATRVAVTTTLLAVCGIFLVVALLLALRVSARAAAAAADAALADPRQPAAAALSLEPAAKRGTGGSPVSSPTPLAQLLTSRTLEAAAATLGALPAKKLIPWRFLGMLLAALLVPLGGIGALALAQPAAFATVARRLLHPGTDIPPFSKLVKPPGGPSARTI